MFTRLADSERREARGRNEAEGLGANHKHFSCLAKSPVEDRFKNRDKSITFAYDSYHPYAVSLLEVLLKVFFERGSRQTMAALQLQLISLSSRNLFSYPLTTGDQLE